MKTFNYITFLILFSLFLTANRTTADPYIINDTVTWTNNVDVYYGIVINPGAILTIESTVRFDTDARLIVERGGKLIVDGGTLTNLVSGSLWPGIEVWGRTDKSQYSDHPNGYPYQGKAVFIDGALVENAFIGVLAGKTDDEFDFEDMDGFPVIPIEPGYTGGIIMAHSSEFRNNKIGVYLPEYENFHPVNKEPRDNLSYFKNCDFKLTSTLVTDTDPTAFIKLVGVGGILSEGNHFINDFVGNATKNISGILSLNSSFSVKEYCLDNYTPCQSFRISSFQELQYGLRAFGSGTEKTFFLDTANFFQNNYGVLVMGVDNFLVTRNLMEDKFCGIWLSSQLSGFRIEENIFINPPQHSPLAGIVFANTGEARNELYRNYFLNYSTGAAVQAWGNNKCEETGSGLIIRCNIFNNNLRDILVTEHGINTLGIATYQGSPAPYPDAPAGNIFSWYAPPDSDIRNVCEHIYYYYHDLYPPTPLEPEYISGVTKIPNTGALWNDYSCPSNINPPGGGQDEEQLRILIADANQQAESIQTVINALKDAGDTDALYWDVSLSAPWQSFEVYNELMSASPYISDEVLAAAIEKENVLIDAMIRNILVANPHSAKNNELLDLLEQRLQPLPDYMWNEILDGRDIVSAYENLQANLSYYRNKEAEYQKQLIHLYLNENTADAKDSIVNMLLAGNSLQQWYRASLIRQEQGDNAAALNILNAIPSSFNLDSEKLAAHSDILAFVSKTEVLWQQGQSIYLPDSTTIVWLLDMMDYGTEPASNYARNILVAHDIVEYEFDIPLPDFNKTYPVRHQKRPNAIQQDDFIRLHPNPAKDFVIINYDLQDFNPDDAQAFFTVTGIDGKAIETEPLQKIRDQVVFPLSGYTPGTYIITIYFGNRIVESKRFIVH